MVRLTDQVQGQLKGVTAGHGPELGASKAPECHPRCPRHPPGRGEAPHGCPAGSAPPAWPSLRSWTQKITKTGLKAMRFKKKK